MHQAFLDAAGHPRQPVTSPGHHAGRLPPNKGRPAFRLIRRTRPSAGSRATEGSAGSPPGDDAYAPARLTGAQRRPRFRRSARPRDETESPDRPLKIDRSGRLAAPIRRMRSGRSARRLQADSLRLVMPIRMRISVESRGMTASVASCGAVLIAEPSARSCVRQLHCRFFSCSDLLIRA